MICHSPCKAIDRCKEMRYSVSLIIVNQSDSCMYQLPRYFEAEVLLAFSNDRLRCHCTRHLDTKEKNTWVCTVFLCLRLHFPLCTSRTIFSARYDIQQRSTNIPEETTSFSKIQKTKRNNRTITSHDHRKHEIGHFFFLDVCVNGHI